MIPIKDYFEILELLEEVDLNIDRILLKLTQFCEYNKDKGFCLVPEITKLNAFDVEQRYHQILEMPEYKKINLLMKYLEQSKGNRNEREGL